MLAVALGGLLVTLVIEIARPVGFVYGNPQLNVALVTFEASIGLLAAFLVVGRLRRSRRLDELLLCLGLALLGATNVAFAAVPAVLWVDMPVALTWASVVTRLVGYGLLAAASFAPRRPVTLDVRRAGVLAASLLLLLVLAAGWAYAVEPRLPAPPTGSEAVGVAVAPALVVSQLLSAALFLIAAVGFTRRAEQDRDALLSGLAVGCALGMVARVNFALFPSLFTDVVSFGDLFRLLFYLAVLVAAILEIREHWAGSEEAAALEERRRIARDLHDGLAQELASIRRNLAWLDGDDEFVRRASAGCDRALADARRAIAALRDHSDRPFPDALAETADRVGRREGITVSVAIGSSARLTRAQREALLLIASEGITNAARHGRAEHVRVELAGTRRPRLLISDAGVGFDARTLPVAGHGAFGLQGMHERAGNVGARVRVESSPGAGTRVVVAL